MSRFDQVEEACSQTFEWLFAKPELGFRSWLESGKGLYWCRGHPASGKSTLMKWVFKDSRTAAALTTQDGKQAKVNFFFHDRGSEIQKSFKGLLQGIVYQILHTSRELVPSVLPVYRVILRRLQPSWTEEDLKKAFQCILEQEVLQLDITLFLDALDEYNGSYESIASFLQSISAPLVTYMTRFKICFSSRPVQIFLDKFMDVPGFDIHEYTMEDIKLVIHSKMSQNSRMSQYMQADNPEDRLLTIEFGDKISSKAEGIFLWVILVLDELLEEFTEGETMKGFMKKLDWLPRKLEDFYQHTLDRLPSKYLDDNMLIFEVLQCANGPLQLHDLFEICRCAKISSLVECTPCTAANSVYDNDSLQRWIRSRTAGLAQVVLFKNEDVDLDPTNIFCPTPYRHGETIYLVQFLHQTVKTFSLSAYRAVDSTSHHSLHNNGHACIARYILALLFHHSQNDSDVQRRLYLADDRESVLERKHFWGRFGAYFLIEPLAKYAKLAESRIPKVLLPSFVEFGDDRISELFHLSDWTMERSRSPLTSVSAFAVVFELCDLLDELLKQNSAKVLRSSPPLLHLAVTQKPLYFPIDSKKRSRIIRILLNHGANAREIFKGQTAYERICKLAITGELLIIAEVLPMVLPFLEAGQDLNVKIKYSRRLHRGQRIRNYRCGEQCLLHHAAFAAQTGLITALLEHGADVNAVGDFGSTPLDCVCDIERDGVTPQLSEMADEVIQQAASSDKKLHYYLEAASLLVSRGARYGVPTADANGDFFVDAFGDANLLVERKPLTRTHIDGLRSRGICTLFRLLELFERCSASYPCLLEEKLPLYVDPHQSFTLAFKASERLLTL